MKPVPSIDHDGKRFRSFSAMARAHGAEPRTVQQRLRRGIPLKDALEAGRNVIGKLCKDHMGNEYRSKADMCEALGITRSVLDKRLEAGQTLEQAISKPARQRLIPFTADDGTVYPSIAAYCAAYGESPMKYYKRRSADKKRGDASRPAKAFEDPLGRTFPTFKAMCDAWHRHPATVRTRLAKGIPLEAALQPPENEGLLLSDGTWYASVAEAAAAHGMARATLAHRLRRGQTPDEALMAIPPDTRIDDRLTIIAHIDDGYHAVIFDGRETVWTRQRILRHIREADRTGEARHADGRGPAPERAIIPAATAKEETT